jgi:hypothetical protein
MTSVSGLSRQRARLGDVRVDRMHAPLACDRHPVVTVEDEVRVAELVHDDRRKRGVAKRALDPMPPRAHVRAARQEGAVEVGGSAVRADHAVERYRAHADVRPFERS